MSLKRVSIDSLTSNSYAVGLLIVLSCAACGKSPQPSELRPVSVNNSPTPAFSALPPALATPAQSNLKSASSEAEVAGAIARVFNHAATVEDGVPTFFVGDFNGDGSEDLAVLTKPNEAALPEINDELANWILEDPREVAVAEKKTGEPAHPKAVKAQRTDRLLTIIHGIGPQGWRNPEARQAFLLRNAAGTNMTVEGAARLRLSPRSSNSQLRGDAIHETVNGQRGLIYWTGAKYAWTQQP
jgi:hypothetical protein